MAGPTDVLPLSSTVDSLDEISEMEFDDQKPLLLRNVSRNNRQLWTKEHLLKNYGDTNIHVGTVSSLTKKGFSNNAIFVSLLTYLRLQVLRGQR